MTEAVEYLSEMAHRLGVSFGARLVRQPKSVFEELDVTFTRDEWAEFNQKAGTNYPYPFADVLPFPPPTPIEEKKP